MTPEIMLNEFGFTAFLTQYKQVWSANLTHNYLYAVNGDDLKRYIQFLEYVDFFVRELNSQKECVK